LGIWSCWQFGWSKIQAFPALVKSSWDSVSSLSHLFPIFHHVISLWH
jgi:hypothetical protein